MKASDTVYTDTYKVQCDGGKGALGHPLVYLDMTGKSEISCPYCSRHFLLQKEPKTQ